MRKKTSTSIEGWERLHPTIVFQGTSGDSFKPYPIYIILLLINELRLVLYEHIVVINYLLLFLPSAP